MQNPVMELIIQQTLIASVVIFDVTMGSYFVLYRTGISVIWKGETFVTQRMISTTSIYSQTVAK